MYTIEFIAKAIGGKVIGNGSRRVGSISPIDDISEGSVVFVKSRDNYALLEGKKGPLCVVVGFEPVTGVHVTGGSGTDLPFDFIVVDSKEMDEAFIKLLSLFEKKDFFPGGVSKKASLSPKAVFGNGVSIDDFVTVGDNTSIGDGTSIGAHASIGRDCSIGKRCLIHPNVTIYPNTIIEDNVILHAGAVIGSDGFGYSSIGGINQKIPQIGGVKIERNVEIGANSTVDRATLGYTVIGENTKIDNLVQIAHNTVIGKNTIICGLCGVSGSVKIGNNVLMGGAVGIADHVTIEDEVYIGAKSGVMDKVVKKGRKIFGTPAVNFKAEMEFVALKPKIKAMFFDLKKIKEKLGL